MKTLTITVSTTLARAIAQVAERENISRSELLRRAVVQYLARDTAAGQSRSALDLAGKLAGSLHGTPVDLASGAGHMKGYGR